MNVSVLVSVSVCMCVYACVPECVWMRACLCVYASRTSWVIVCVCVVVCECVCVFFSAHLKRDELNHVTTVQSDLTSDMGVSGMIACYNNVRYSLDAVLLYGVP